MSKSATLRFNLPSYLPTSLVCGLVTKYCHHLIGGTWQASWRGRLHTPLLGGCSCRPGKRGAAWSGLSPMHWLLLLWGLPQAGLRNVHGVEYSWPNLDLHQQGHVHQLPSLLWRPWRLGG